MLGFNRMPDFERWGKFLGAAYRVEDPLGGQYVYHPMTVSLVDQLYRERQIKLRSSGCDHGSLLGCWLDFPLLLDMLEHHRKTQGQYGTVGPMHFTFYYADRDRNREENWLHLMVWGEDESPEAAWRHCPLRSCILGVPHKTRQQRRRERRCRADRTAFYSHAFTGPDYQAVMQFHPKFIPNWSKYPA